MIFNITVYIIRSLEVWWRYGLWICKCKWMLIHNHSQAFHLAWQTQTVKIPFRDVTWRRIHCAFVQDEFPSRLNICTRALIAVLYLVQLINHCHPKDSNKSLIIFNKLSVFRFSSLWQQSKRDAYYWYSLNMLVMPYIWLNILGNFHQLLSPIYAARRLYPLPSLVTFPSRFSRLVENRCPVDILHIL